MAEIGWRAISPAKEFGTGGSGKEKGPVVIPIESVDTLRSCYFLLASIRNLPRRMYSPLNQLVNIAGGLAIDQYCRCA